MVVGVAVREPYFRSACGEEHSSDCAIQSGVWCASVMLPLVISGWLVVDKGPDIGVLVFHRATSACRLGGAREDFHWFEVGN